MKYAIKHKSSGKFLYEDTEVGTSLVNEGFITWSNKKLADEYFEFFYNQLWIESIGKEIPINEFEVCEVQV